MDYFHQIAEQNIKRLREQEERNKRSLEEYKRRVELLKYTEDDYSVRKNRGKVESYNIHTGDVLYTYPNCEEFTVQEAWNDIRDEFRGN